MTDWLARNVAKIPKAVYLLLERYHRTHGLSAVGWCGASGQPGLAFYLLGARDAADVPWHLLPTVTDWPLSVSQGRIAVGAGSRSGAADHPEQWHRELDSHELLRWYEDQLGLRQVLGHYEDGLTAWRRTYHVAESEPYLFTWNVMGLVSTATGYPILTYGRAGDYQGQDQSLAMGARMLGVAKPTEHVHSCARITFSTDGRAVRPDGTILNLWSKRAERHSVSDIVDWVLDRTEEPKKW